MVFRSMTNDQLHASSSLDHDNVDYAWIKYTLDHINIFTGDRVWESLPSVGAEMHIYSCTDTILDYELFNKLHIFNTY